jgi:formate dehydrogenase major subunit
MNDGKAGKLPFIMKPLGVGTIFGSDLPDGPFPEHYEPLESPLQQNPLSTKYRFNPTIPVAKILAAAKRPDIFFPRTGGTLLRARTVGRALANRRHDKTHIVAVEMQPQMFVEISRNLQREGNQGGEKVTSLQAAAFWPSPLSQTVLSPLR